MDDETNSPRFEDVYPGLQAADISDEEQHAAEHDLLNVLYNDYPGAADLGPAAQFGRARYPMNLHQAQALRRALTSVVDKGYAERQGGAGHLWVTLTPDGIREVSRRRGIATQDDLQATYQIVTEQMAKFGEMLTEQKAVQSQLDQSLQEIGASIEANRQEQEALTSRIQDFETKLLESERGFYSRIFPLFAVFIAAFALIITGTQTITRTTATDPWLISGQSIAMMGPITLFVLVLIGAAWLLVRPRAR
jgi:hypothetical protein